MFFVVVVGKTDVDHQFKLSAEDWQLMVSAESISVKEKRKVARHIEFLVPGIMAGNELPPFPNKSENISRRLGVVIFSQFVYDVDPTLFDRIQHELPAIMKKSNNGLFVACVASNCCIYCFDYIFCLCVRSLPYQS